MRSGACTAYGLDQDDGVTSTCRGTIALAGSARGCQFLGTELAVLGGAMTWVSERNLVAAIGNAGGFGVVACGAMMPDRLSEEIAATGAD